MKNLFFSLFIIGFVFFPVFVLAQENTSQPAGSTVLLADQNTATNPTLQRFLTDISKMYLSPEKKAILQPKAGETVNSYVQRIRAENIYIKSKNGVLLPFPEELSNPVDPLLSTLEQAERGIERQDRLIEQRNTATTNTEKPNTNLNNQPVTVLDRLTNNAFKGDSLGGLLNQIFYAGLAIAVILAIVMIIRGGIEYMTVDSMYSKDSGKKRVQAAMGGLLLAFSAILILNTINPELTTLDLKFERLQTVDPTNVTGIDLDISNSISKYEGLTEAQYVEMVQSGRIPTNISPAAQKILAEAINTLGFQSSKIRGTASGRRACAAVVNMIIKQATGVEAGGGYSTANMKTALNNNSRFVLVPGGLQNSLPGDIVLSPTKGSSIGHTGIVTSPGAASIISNSSGNRNRKEPSEVKSNFNATSWRSTYQGLEILIYRPL